MLHTSHNACIIRPPKKNGVLQRSRSHQFGQHEQYTHRTPERSFGALVLVLATRLAIAIPAAITPAACSGNNTTTTEIATTKDDVQANSFCLWLANNILEKLSANVFDELRRREAVTDLQALEATLERVNGENTSRIRSLREHMSEKTSPEDIRRIVRDVIAEMERRLQSLDTRLDRAKLGMKAMEDAFGYLPTATPSPLLQHSLDGKPSAHPFTVEWAKLVSERNGTS